MLAKSREENSQLKQKLNLQPGIMCMILFILIFEHSQPHPSHGVAKGGAGYVRLNGIVFRLCIFYTRLTVSTEYTVC